MFNYLLDMDKVICVECNKEFKLDKYDGSLQCSNNKCSMYPVGFYPKTTQQIKVICIECEKELDYTQMIWCSEECTNKTFDRID